MVRLLFLVLLLWLGHLLISALRRSLRTRQRPPAEKTPQGEMMVRDPHCGLFLPQNQALSQTVNGERLYFCSERCRDAYRGRS